MQSLANQPGVAVQTQGAHCQPKTTHPFHGRVDVRRIAEIADPPVAVLGEVADAAGSTRRTRRTRCRCWPAGSAVQLDQAVRFHAALGDRVRAHNLVREADRENFRAHVVGYFFNLDLLITPTLATPPIQAALWGQRSWPRVFAANTRYAPYSAPWNHAGYPAVSVPAGVHPRTGTPLSVQLVAPDGGEQLLLGVAALLQRLAPGF